MKNVFAAMAWVAFWGAACVPEAALKDLCEDDPVCASDPGCPFEPPNRGVDCDLPEGAECFYCTKDDRIDASHYECDANEKWDRRANTDCE